MHLLVVTPAPPGSTRGNRVTAERWARLLRASGHAVTIAEHFLGQPCDALVALHARRSAPAVAAFAAARPGAPVVVVLTGTDLYHDIHHDQSAQRCLRDADRLVVLHDAGAADLPAEVRGKTVAIPQSVALPEGFAPEPQPGFAVAVVGHLRAVKDPLCAARAVRDLPAASAVAVLQLGGALEPEWGAEAEREQARNPRYRWLGELPHDRALRVLAGCRLHVNSSEMEGGANALSEALAVGVPSLVSRIPSSLGMLGEDYPGTFAVGDDAALRALLLRCERDAAFYGDLARRTAQRAPAVRPDEEQRRLAALVSAL